MAAINTKPELPLVVIVGPTASGKTGLAVRIAQQFGGEIVSADSRAIYRHLTIGTAKPTSDEQQGIPHWGIDLVDPGERFTAADFKHYANSKIAEIRSRGKVPILAGGTGLYIDSVLYDFEFSAIADDVAMRDRLMGLSLEELHKYCIENNVMLPENKKNKRYVVNNILRNGRTPKRKHEPNEDVIVVGIATEKSILRQRIEQRASTIVTQKTIDEAVKVAKEYGWDNEAMTGNIYPLIHRYVNNELTLNDMQEKSITSDWRLAKRQLTWFRRNEHICWLTLDDAYTYIARRLAPLNNS